MNWKVRHQGSPRAVDGLDVQQVVEGLQDGLWEPTDEVVGPQDRNWVAIENHPQFAEAAAEIEAPPPKVHEDETRLDMNPLIDVALVLLIFFILTTSYAALQRVLEMPGGSSADTGPPTITKQKIKETMILVQARMRDGKPVMKVENDEVDEKYLSAALSKYVKNTRKTYLLIDAEGVDWGTVVHIQDAAKGADMDKIYFVKKKPTGASVSPAPP
jgi:biopolymer transport protein ExbD